MHARADHEDDPENEDEGTREGTGTIGSGPLVDPTQITGTLSARLLQRWSQPLDRHRERYERGDTDEVETLSPSDAHLLSRFLAQPPAGFAVEGSSPLPPIEQLPTMQRQSVSPSGALSRRFAAARDTRTATPVMISSAPRVTPPAPLDVARLAMRSFHLAVAPEGFLPAHVLMLLDGHTRRLWLAPVLLLLAVGTSADWHTRLATAIEARPFTRYLLAALWSVMHAEMPQDAPPASSSLSVLFAPASGLTRHPWQRWHGAWHTRIWRQTNRLVASHLTLDRLTACYLGLHEGERVPRLGVERQRAVLENALRILPALRAECQTPDELTRAAWQHYTRYLARTAAVPHSVIVDRLSGDRGILHTPDDLCRWTDALLVCEPEMGHWRRQVAVACGQAMTSETPLRTGVYQSASQRIALWLAEPS